MDLSVIIPAFNESRRLPKTLPQIVQYLQAQAYSSEIILVDDGSTDDTTAIARQAGVHRIIQHPRNLGKGAAVRSGMLAAQGTWRFLCDADLSMPIADLPKLQWASRQVDIVIGSRRAPGANVVKWQAGWKVALGRMGNLLVRWLLVPDIQDTQCGFKLFHERTKPIFTLQRLQRFGYDFELLYLARRLGYHVREVPITWINDPLTTVKPIDYLDTMLDIARIHWYRLRGYYKTAVSF